MDAADAEFTPKTGRRRLVNAKDPRYASAPSISFGRRHAGELNTLASNRPFYCKTGTHRCPQAEVVLDKQGKRDDKKLEEWRKKGTQWKITPGPGTYRTPRAVGGPTNPQEARREMDLNSSMLSGRIPRWSLGSSGSQLQHLDAKATERRRPDAKDARPKTGARRPRSEGRVRKPTPRREDSPGPGWYFRDVECAPTIFADFHRPQAKG